MHIQVSKDLCRLSSELPFDLEECELAMEEDAAGGVDLKKLVKVRACMGYTWTWDMDMGRMPHAVWRVHGACTALWRGACIACGMVWCVRGVACSCAQGSCPARLL